VNPLRASRVKDYLERFAQEDDILQRIKQHARLEGLPKIEIPSPIGKLLYLLAKLQQAQSILEIGTLAGYSTVWLARALPSHGRLISLECDPKHVQLTREHLTWAGCEARVEVREGLAETLLNQMLKTQLPFDMIFIDADKAHALVYLDRALRLSRSGTLIVIDNLIPKGDLIGTPENTEAISVYRFNEVLALHPKLEAVLLPTLVDDGRLDGLSLARVR